MRFIPKVCRYSKILLVCRNRRHCSSSRISDLCKYFQQFSSKIPSCIRTYLSSCSRLVEFSIRSGGNELTSFHVYFLCIWSGIKRVNNCFLLILSLSFELGFREVFMTSTATCGKCSTGHGGMAQQHGPTCDANNGSMC